MATVHRMSPHVEQGEMEETEPNSSCAVGGQVGGQLLYLMVLDT